MTAEYLTETARLMRETANAATPGPWDTYEEHGRDYTDEGWSQIGVKSSTRDVAATYPTGRVEHDQHEADAEHIAKCDPPFLLAVADWIDITAKWVERDERRGASPLTETDCSALKVARTFRGDS